MAGEPEPGTCQRHESPFTPFAWCDASAPAITLAATASYHVQKAGMLRITVQWVLRQAIVKNSQVCLEY